VSGGAPPEGAVLRRLVDAPTVKVELLELPSGERAVRKLYSFPRWSQRLRGALRHSWLGQPKGEREAGNLSRLAAGGAPVVAPSSSGSERDALGFVRQSWLLLPYLEGRLGLDQIVAGAAAPPGPDGADALWRQVGRGVRKIHQLGCFYRDLRPRNLLVGEADQRWIDASKSRWFPAPLEPARAAEDLAGLLLPLPVEEGERAWIWTCVRGGYGAFQELADPSALAGLLGGRGRRRLEAVLRRERLRQRA